MLEIQTRRRGNAVIVTVEGKITFETVNRLNAALQHASAAYQPKRLLLDLEEATEVDSAGVGVLVGIRNLMNRNMGQLYLCNACPRVLGALKNMNLQNYFSIIAVDQGTFQETDELEALQAGPSNPFRAR
jgi:anti-anti-sigma factor